tara:strand:- start:163 stop:1884 length:1722 start_codon:yes stop_codon:yes gene_type:complete
MSKKTLYVILDKASLTNNFYAVKKDVFTLNEYVLSEKEKKSINHFFPNPKKTSKEAEFLFLKTIDLKNQIYGLIKKNKYFENIKNVSELLDPFLEIKISQFLYLSSVIPKYDNYILVNKKNKISLTSKFDLIITIEKIYNKSKSYGFIGKFSRLKNNNNLNILLLEIQKFIIKKIFFLIKKDVNFFSDERAYYMKYLIHKLNKKGVINFYLSSSTSLLKNFKIILYQIINLLLIKNIKKLEFFLLPHNKKNYDLDKFNLNIKFTKSSYLEKKYFDYLNKQIYDYLLITDNYFEYLDDIFKTKKIKNSYFHSMRFPEFFSISRIFNKFNKNIYLISHGSHTKQIKGIDIRASKSIGIGLTYTKENKIKIISQSIFCDEFLDSLKIKYLRSNFIISKGIKVVKKKNDFSKTRKTKILYIGTVKYLGARRYYYESSAELLESINQIYSKLEKYKDLIEINIRVRDVQNEINNKILKNAFKDKMDLLSFNNHSSLIEEIKNCQCIISYSSTTLEEGINLYKPVMCYGLPSYNHLKNYYEVNKENKFTNYYNLHLIEEALGRKFIINKGLERKLDINF